MQPGPPQYYPQPAPPTKKAPVWIIILVVVLGLVVLLIGTLVILGVYGTRRFVAAAKTAEAKNTIGAIARGARQSYEREQLDGDGNGVTQALCKSALTVPTTVPSGSKYMPAVSGADFDTGDAKTGWKCLKFSMTQPMYYQYSYSQGSGYLAKAIDPGPTGFEAAARGDIDGDGTTSLFAVTGAPAGGVVTVSTAIHIENEFE